MATISSTRGAQPRWRLAYLLSALLMVVGFITASPAPAANAISAADWDPGYIISDDEFYNGAAMTEAEIQAFLDAKIGRCLTDRCLNVAVLPVTGRAASYSADTGRLVCSAIAGGTMRASDLIYRTQAACGISAKVILVTLQKEQGLVTSRAPSDWALRAAMGMGCPDTAPCSDAFAGLATQIMAGTRQLKVYKVGGFGRQPGVQAIQYHPNAACGAPVINVRNYATAALYNYTPYQPNAAALANLYGTGDGCSSYGNRNFWRFYTDWFSSPGGRAMDAAYARNGGAAGVLGALVGDPYCTTEASVCTRAYENGTIFWNKGVGAYVTVGEIDSFYLGSPPRRASMGVPTGDRHAIGGGYSQPFRAADVFSSSTGTWAAFGVIRDAFAVNGGPTGPLGWPTAGDECGLVEGGCLQRFQSGIIYYGPSTGTFAVSGAIQATYLALGAQNGVLGYPAGPATATTAAGGGTVQAFRNGRILQSGAGTFAVYGTIHTKYMAQGGPSGALGWPTAVRSCATDGTCSQRFQNGTLSFDAITEFVAGRSQSLGPAIGTTVAVSAGGGGIKQSYRAADVYSSALGTFAVYGVIRSEFDRLGGAAAFGWPLANDECGIVEGGCQQRFQSGTMYYSPNSGTFGVPNTADALYASMRGPAGSLGYPTSASQDVTGGTRQSFRAADIYSSARGTAAVFGVIRTEYSRVGGPTGALGWPLAGDECGLLEGGCLQRFERGGVYYSPVSGTWSTTGTVHSLYTSIANPGPGGSFGYPSGVQRSITAGIGGVMQPFRAADIYASARGTFPVYGVMRTEYDRVNGPAGRLGWPVTGDQCGLIEGGCQQRFETGGIYFVPSSGTWSTSGAIDNLYTSIANPGPTGSMGYPTGPETTVSAGAGGVMQSFRAANVYSSPLSTAAVYGVIRTEYLRMGGPGGTLGWPTAGDECGLIDGGCLQRFQGGVIYYGPTGTFTVPAALADAYAAAGGPGGRLGWPTADAVCTAAGCTQAFQRGSLP